MDRENLKQLLRKPRAIWTVLLVIVTVWLFAEYYNFAIRGNKSVAGSELISVESLSAKYNQHFANVIACGNNLDANLDRDTERKMSCARSAWALGLVGQARRDWNDLLSNPRLKGLDKVRSQLAYAMLELQEYNYEKARLLAQEVVSKLEDSNLKAQFMLLIGESLTAEGRLDQANNYFTQAYNIGDDVVKSWAKYMMAENKLKSKRVIAARDDYLQVDAASEYAKNALIRLVQIDFDNKDFDNVLLWGRELRENHLVTDEMPWLRYTAIEAYIRKKNIKAAVAELERLGQETQNRGTWYTLSVAAMESYIGKEELASKMEMAKIVR